MANSRRTHPFPYPYRDEEAAEGESESLMADTERTQPPDGAQLEAGADAGPPAPGPAPLRAEGPHPDAPLDDGSTLHAEAEEHSGPLPTPLFMLDDDDSKRRCKWFPYPLRRLALALAKWSRGPPNARPWRITPLFPAIQEYPLRLLDRLLPNSSHRLWLLALYFSVYVVTFVLVKRQGSRATDIPGWGEPQSIGCGATYWAKGNLCGLNGDDCRPFADSGFPFRCPAKCSMYQVLDPRAVGDQEINYHTFVIGGGPTANASQPPTYRGDSFICQAALHSGVISDDHGGCGVVDLVGRQDAYVGNLSNGISSFAFDSYFPQSFQFLSGIQCTASDPRWSLMAVTIVFTTVLSLFTVSPALFFFSNFVGLFWTVGMALDAPPYASTAALFSDIVGKFLPAMFCAWVIFDKMGVRRTLHGLTAQVEKLVLWLGPCWVGAMTNYTFDFIPIQRLNAYDIKTEPGAKAALAIIIIVLVLVVLVQAFFFRQEARLVPYLKLYAIFLAAIIVSVLLPGVDLRIHHYVLALLLLPGTSMQTRLSLVYQGLLVGFFINGVARWGFASVLQTPASLQGNAPNGSELPTILPPVIHLANGTNETSSIAFKWTPPDSVGLDGISVLVNDVERFRSYFHDTLNPQSEFVWTRNATVDDMPAKPEYFRFAYMDGSNAEDYTKAGTWAADGSWTPMGPGPSRIKMRSVGGDEVLRRRP